MPTGLTYPIEQREDYTFREFALACALQFSACFHQRDETGAKPRHREVDEHYISSLKSAEAKLVELQGMSLDTAKAVLQAMRERRIEENSKRRKEWVEKADRYAKMRHHVLIWQPPTPEYANLKKFMLEQIAISFDEEREPYQAELPEPDPAAWLAEEIDWARQIVEQRRSELKKQQEYVAEANAWIDALYMSLEGT